MAPRSWRPVPKSDPRYSPTKRLYLSPQNRVVSRRQYDNARLQLQGWDSKADFDRRFSATKNRGYARWLDAASENTDIDPKQLAKAGSDFNDAFLRARDSDFDNNPDGSFAEFLEMIGLRNPDSNSPVGSGDTGFA